MMLLQYDGYVSQLFPRAPPAAPPPPAGLAVTSSAVRSAAALQALLAASNRAKQAVVEAELAALPPPPAPDFDPDANVYIYDQMVRCDVAEVLRKLEPAQLAP